MKCVIILLYIVNDFQIYTIIENSNELISFPDISKWNTSKVEDISFLFSECSSIEKLPDISNWNTEKVNNMSNIFNGCKSLLELPGIQKWNTSNIKDLSF